MIFRSQSDRIQETYKKYFPHINLNENVFSVFYWKIEDYVEKKKFLSKHYMLRQLVRLFMTQTIPDNIQVETIEDPEILFEDLKNSTKETRFKQWDQIPVISTE